MSRQRFALGALSLVCSFGLGCGGDDGGNDMPTAVIAGSGGQMMQQPSTGGTPVGMAGMMAPPVSTGGVAAPAATGTGGMAGTMAMAGTGGMEPMMPIDKGPAMDECGLKTKYEGDAYCILPPPEDKGFQLHIGPSNYDNPESKYILPAGAELTTDFAATSGNDHDIYFYYRQFRQRPGAHHNIITANDGTSLGLGHRIGTSNSLSDDTPKNGMIAPENKGVGIKLGAHAPINVSWHSINTGEKDELRELWVNFWYRPDAEVTEPVNEVFATGSVTFAIAPGEDTVLGPFTCNVSGSGRMLWMYGHRHANNVSFVADRIRGGKRENIYSAFKWEEPLVLDYSSTVTNMPADLAKGIEGGWNGILDLKAGDQIEWSCHIINKTDGTLRFTNNTYTGEMCIVDAELVGANCL
jgi:hypothetical protein